MVIKGKVVVKINGRDFPVGRNSCFQIPPGETSITTSGYCDTTIILCVYILCVCVYTVYA